MTRRRGFRRHVSDHLCEAARLIKRCRGGWEIYMQVWDDGIQDWRARHDHELPENDLASVEQLISDAEVLKLIAKDLEDLALERFYQLTGKKP